ncbi:MAG: nucleotidyltransferase [Lachnospiraceae bacterium]|nr:nucleotidyltransferase [Lachnospiraceae bacterium]
MKVTGIIAEYNPFHNGHFYQLEQARKCTDADYLIVVMSGDFVQRGAPALIDKYTRAQMALSCGADLILELPVLWATASAEYFACGAVSLLDQLGVTNALCFGCETPDNSAFFALSRLLCEEPVEYQIALNTALKEGCNYPKARQEALYSIFKNDSSHSQITDSISHDSLPLILGSPNNILGLEYCKSLHQRNSSIYPVPIQRIGNGYHESDLDSDFVSATGIRSYLNDSMNFYSDLPALKAWMPQKAYDILTKSLETHPLLFEDDFSGMLGYALLCGDSFTTYADGSNDLSNRICKMKKNYRSISSFLADLKTKEVTYARLSRLLFHILLDIEKKDYGIYRNLDYVLYAKILGFQKSAAPLLKSLKANSQIPLLTGFSKKKSLLDQSGLALLEKDMFASELYRLASVQKSGFSIPHEYEQKFLTL